LVINRGWISAVRVFGLCILATASFCIMQVFLWLKCRYFNGLRLPRCHTECTDLRRLELVQPDGKSLEITV
jgi:hypothetical protein